MDLPTTAQIMRYTFSPQLAEKHSDGVSPLVQLQMIDTSTLCWSSMSCTIFESPNLQRSAFYEIKSQRNYVPHTISNIWVRGDDIVADAIMEQDPNNPITLVIYGSEALTADQTVRDQGTSMKRYVVLRGQCLDLNRFSIIRDGDRTTGGEIIVWEDTTLSKFLLDY